MSRLYAIINRSDVSDVDFSQVLETSAETLRFSVAGTQTFVKYEGLKPPFLQGKSTLTHAQILTELQTDVWNPPIDE
jgi:hypothetical protein